MEFNFDRRPEIRLDCGVHPFRLQRGAIATRISSRTLHVHATLIEWPEHRGELLGEIEATGLLVVHQPLTARTQNVDIDVPRITMSVATTTAADFDNAGFFR